jgi:hypothetical protein
MKRVLFVALAVAGCGGAMQSPEACLGPKLAVIETQYMSEALRVCAGQTWQECPSREALEKKFDAMRDEARKACE